MADPAILLTVAATFVLAGAVKGVIGLGLPTVSLALLTLALDLPSAMALLLVPSFVTNLWQALVGGHARVVLRRIAPFLIMASVTVWIGALALTRVRLPLLSGLLGVSLTVYAGVNLAGYRPTVSARSETWVGMVLGAINGILTGMTGGSAVPGVMFLQAIGLPRDMLIQAMGMLFSVSILALAMAMGANGLLTVDLGALSTAAVVPAIVGMWLGQRLRHRLSEQRFRQVFFLALLALGLYFVVRTIGR